MNRKRAGIIITLICFVSVLVLGYATLQGLRESGALSRYQVWVTNQTGQNLFVHTVATPFVEDWEKIDVQSYGDMRVAQLLPGQTIHMMSSKVRNERTGQRVHPERFFVLVDSNYRADSFGTFLVSRDPESGNPSWFENTFENLIGDLREVKTNETRWRVIDDGRGVIQLELVEP